MKTHALIVTGLAAMAIHAQAGQPLSEPYKSTKNPIPEGCFGETELQLDTYALHANHNGDTGWGGGLAVNYFFHRFLGAGVDVNVAGNDETAWNYSAHFLVRYPTELGPLCLSPYLKFSAGITDHETTAGFIGAGAGFEVRFTHEWGVFGEGTYNWAAADEDFAQARAGIRWVF